MVFVCWWSCGVGWFRLVLWLDGVDEFVEEVVVVS